ncbi:MAG: prepilin peptidase [Acidimicrobiia bacterium]
MPSLVLSLVIGVLSGPIAHHLAVQAGADQPFALAAAVCRRCGTRHGHLASVCQFCTLGTGRVWLTAAVAGVVSGGVAWRLGMVWVLVSYLVFVFLTVVLFLTDIDHKRIPNRITYPGTPLAATILLGGAALDGTGAWFLRALLAALAFSGFFLLVYLAARGGFGFGDVKLAVLLGLFLGYLGWDRLLVAGFVTAAVGGLMALVAVVAGHAGAKTEIPYGPAMILGAWVTIVGGQPLVDLLV